MGLAEYIEAGASLTRNVISLQTDITGSGSVDLGSAYALLSIETNVPCRLRLYDKNDLQNVGEKIRPFNNTNVSASVSLIGDFSMSAAGVYTIDPALYGTPTTVSYYKLDGDFSTNFPLVKFTRYLMEQSEVSTANRVTLTSITGSNLSPGQYEVGKISNLNIPKTYLLVSASLSNAAHIARLRLYSRSGSLTNATEIARPFKVEPSASAALVVDAILSGSETTYFVPKIIGANLANMTSDIVTMAGSQDKIAGNNELYYVLHNSASSGGAVNLSISLHVFALES